MEGIGLYDYGARFYDPALGRWAQPDSVVPLLQQGEQAWDRYAYTNNSPINYTDPNGHAIPNPLCQEGCVLWDFSGYNRAVRTMIVGALSMVNLATGGATVTNNTNSTWGLRSAEDRFIAGTIPPVFGGVILSDDALQFGKQLIAGHSNQLHHFVTNKNKVKPPQWTIQFGKILNKYGMTTDDPMNQKIIPQSGSHPQKYHEWVNVAINQIDLVANGDSVLFKQLFQKYIVDPVSQNPFVLDKEWWEQYGGEWWKWWIETVKNGLR